MSAESLVALAGRTVAVAASTDAWEACKRGFAPLLGRGDPDRTEAAQRRLEGTREQLTGPPGDPGLERARAAVAERWAARLADLLEDDPDAAADLRALVAEIQAMLPAGVVSAADHTVGAERDVSIEAQGGSLAAGVIHGDVHLTVPRPEPARQPVSLAPRPVFLAGREELLAQVDARLTGGAGAGPRVVALCGLGGAGKTSVAVEYAHRHLAEVGVAWQFAAEDPAVLTAGFGELAAQLGARKRRDARDPVASVHAVLAAYPAKWLLVFDDVPDRASVARFLPPTGRGRVVITSRSALWPPGQGLEVPVLDTAVAAGFLVSRTGDPDQEAALELASELGGLPLALEQAAAYMQATGDSLATYLASFQRRRPDMLARGEPTGYGSTVAATWSLAFGRLEQSAPGAAGLLRLLACCAPDAVPLRLLLHQRPGLAGQLGPQVAPVLVPLLEDELAAGDAVAALRRYSLVTPAGGGLVLVHRLVQAVTLNQMPEELAGRWRAAAAALIEAAIPADTRPREAWRACAALLPHAQATLTADSAGYQRMAQYLGHSGSYAAARDLQQIVADACEQTPGPGHPDTLAARQELAGWTGLAGDPAAARDLVAALLPVAEQTLGPNHPDVLGIRADLARWTGQAGDAAAARDHADTLLPLMEHTLGPEHPQTLYARHNLAQWTGQTGDPAAARDLAAALLPVAEHALGAKHPDTLNIRVSLARWTGDAGDPATARDLLAELLTVFEQALGAEHPDTLGIRHSLAGWTGQAGDPATARDLLAAMLPVAERTLGAEHPYALDVRHSLAGWTGEAGDPAAARDLLAALLLVRERVSGTEHVDTLITRRELAYWTSRAEDTD